MKILLCTSFIMTTLSGMFLFHVKYQVLALEHEYQTTQLHCAQLQEDISVLQSHWCYLTRPERIEALITQHWPHWVKLAPQQVVCWPKIICAQSESGSYSDAHL
ncbi:cell division protein FtsL [Holospora curviuscula]|uniref:Cell division protein FtsL n=1 Tax=Holospora curviuscula TaxID=1082868 RepID=A0A2S5R9Y3_9PROT|nr:hypothetical protein [Holospora curviuscula]PPE04002.1 Cell division protein FtsL [Holospora curviuscula]